MKGWTRLQSDQELGRQNSSEKILTYCFICFFVEHDLCSVVDLTLSFAPAGPNLSPSRRYADEHHFDQPSTAGPAEQQGRRHGASSPRCGLCSHIRPPCTISRVDPWYCARYPTGSPPVFVEAGRAQGNRVSRAADRLTPVSPPSTSAIIRKPNAATGFLRLMPLA